MIDIVPSLLLISTIRLNQTAVVIVYGSILFKRHTHAHARFSDRAVSRMSRAVHHQ